MGGTTGIVIPAYRPDIELLCSYLAAIERELAPDELRVELDDATPASVERLRATPATVHAVGHRRGKGAAVTAGFEALKADRLAFVDADGSTPPAELASILDRLADDDRVLAVGSRRHPGASVRTHQTRVRRRLGDLLVWIARRLLPVALWDYQCGAKAIDRPLWEALRGELLCEGFGWDLELITLAHQHGGTIAEVPITWDDRPGSTVGAVGVGKSVLGALALARLRPYLPHLPRTLVGERTPLLDRASTCAGDRL